MTTTDMTYVLDKHGYNMDTWISLDGVTLLTFLQDTNILVYPLDMRFYFNSTQELIEVVYGETVEGIFTSNAGDTSGFTGTTFIPFSEIGGFISSTYHAANGGFYTKYFKDPDKM